MNLKSRPTRVDSNSYSAPLPGQPPWPSIKANSYGLRLLLFSSIRLTSVDLSSRLVPKAPGYRLVPKSPGYRLMLVALSFRLTQVPGQSPWLQPPGWHPWNQAFHPSQYQTFPIEPDASPNPDLLFYSLSRFECDSHIIPMHIQQCLPPPLTGKVKSSLLKHMYSRLLSLAARLHVCRINHSHYITMARLFLDRPRISEGNEITISKRYLYTPVHFSIISIVKTWKLSVHL